MKRGCAYIHVLIGMCMPLLFIGCARPLETGLTESDAQQIVVLLRENGINATTAIDASQKKGSPTWVVNVRGQSDTLVRAWKILSENGLPREKVKGFDEVFANAGMIPTAAEEKARLLSAVDGELTRTLHSLPGVVDARVQVVLPDTSPLVDRSQQPPPTASALIQFHGDEPPLKEVEVKSLLAKSVQGLVPENVAVVFKRVEIKPIPAEEFGPFSVNEWIEIAILATSGAAGTACLVVIALSQKRKLAIKALEKQLEKAHSAAPAVVKA